MFCLWLLDHKCAALSPHSTSRTSWKPELATWWETSCQLWSGQKLVRNSLETGTQLVAEWPLVLTLKMSPKWWPDFVYYYFKMADDEVKVLACTLLVLAGVGAVIAISDGRKRKIKHKTWVNAYICNRSKLGTFNTLLPELCVCVGGKYFRSTYGCCNFWWVVRTGWARDCPKGNSNEVPVICHLLQILHFVNLSRRKWRQIDAGNMSQIFSK